MILAEFEQGVILQVVVLRLEKPLSFRANPGMYAFINVPSVARAGEEARCVRRHCEPLLLLIRWLCQSRY